MRTVFYVLQFIVLLLLLFCINFVCWLIAKLQLGLRFVWRWPASRNRKWKTEHAMKASH